MTLVFPRDGLEIKYCIPGQRKFFKEQGWNFRKYVREGLDSEYFRSTGDAMAIKLAKYVEEKKS